MKISLDVVQPREAGYAVAMFQGLYAAMLSDPPPGDEFDEPLTEAEAMQAEANAAAGIVTPKKPRGTRRTKAQMEADAALARAKDENALRPGDALKGVSVHSLANALNGMPLVASVDGTEVRVAPGTPAADIEAMKAQIAADTARVAAEQSAQLDLEAAIEAKKKAEAEAAAVEAKKKADAAEAAAKAAAAAKPAADAVDDDLAALFRKPAAETAPVVIPPTAGASKYAGMGRGDLMKAFMAYLNGAGGLAWARGVMLRFNIDVLDDLTEAHIREVLDNPSIVELPQS